MIIYNPQMTYAQQCRADASGGPWSEEAMSGFVVLCEDDPSRTATCEDDVWHPCGVNPVTSVSFIDLCERSTVHTIQLEELEPWDRCGSGLRGTYGGTWVYDVGHTILGRPPKPPYNLQSRSARLFEYPFIAMSIRETRGALSSP